MLNYYLKVYFVQHQYKNIFCHNMLHHFLCCVCTVYWVHSIKLIAGALLLCFIGALNFFCQCLSVDYMVGLCEPVADGSRILVGKLNVLNLIIAVNSS